MQRLGRDALLLPVQQGWGLRLPDGVRGGRLRLRTTCSASGTDCWLRAQDHWVSWLLCTMLVTVCACIFVNVSELARIFQYACDCVRVRHLGQA